MSTARAELTDLAELWEWDALDSPTPNEVIYRRGGMLAFCQYDREGKLRHATLRRMIADALTTVVAHVGWNDPRKATKVGAWMAEFGERPPDRAEMARRRARR